MAIKRNVKKDIAYCPVSGYSKQTRFTVNGLHVADTNAGTIGVMGTLWEVGGKKKGSAKRKSTKMCEPVRQECTALTGSKKIWEMTSLEPPFLSHSPTPQYCTCPW